MRLRKRVKRIEDQLFPEDVNEFQHIQYKGTARMASEALHKVNILELILAEITEMRLRNLFKEILERKKENGC